MQSTGQASTQSVSFFPMQGSAMTKALGHLPYLDPHYACPRRDSSVAEVNSCRMSVRIEEISAVTFRVTTMKASVQFYRDVLGMELVSGGEARVFLEVSR